MTQSKIQRWYGKKKVAARYDSSMRTIERWVKAGRFPKPTRLANGRDYLLGRHRDRGVREEPRGWW
jgi:transposase